VLVPPERTFLCFAGPALMQVDQTTLRAREVYRLPDGWRRTAGISVSVDGLYAAFCETNGTASRIRLLALATRTASTVVETSFEPVHPLIRPRRAQICYRQGQAALWLVDFNGGQNRKLRTAEGAIGETLWGPGGQSLLYLHLPEAGTGLNSIREHRPDVNNDKLVTKTSQFVSFGINGDSSVFVGASRNKASPLVLLLARLARREMSIAEHKAGNPEMTTPIFTPDSQKVVFASDRHGKPAIYLMRVERLVEKTDEDEEPASDSAR
jgi:oligogalacturonide lyase